ncbi:hypothetical protein SBADM41S_01604 [Streptomyces badius]
MAVIGTVLAFALIASAESLFSAAAIDRMHDGPRTDYDKELVAQAVANTLCAALAPSDGTPPTACPGRGGPARDDLARAVRRPASTPARPTRPTYAGNGHTALLAETWRIADVDDRARSGPSWANVAWTKPGSKPCVR